jgi:hypothetical protein
MQIGIVREHPERFVILQFLFAIQFWGKAKPAPQVIGQRAFMLGRGQLGRFCPLQIEHTGQHPFAFVNRAARVD